MNPIMTDLDVQDVKLHYTKRNRTRLTEIQKAKILQYSLQNPKLSQEECLRWAKDQFNLSTVPNRSVLSQWMKDSTRERLLRLVESTENNPFVLEARGQHPVTHPELEKKLYTWFVSKQSQGVGITYATLRAKALQICDELGIQDFKASPGWALKFKHRNGISVRRRIVAGENGDRPPSNGHRRRRKQKSDMSQMTQGLCPTTSMLPCVQAVCLPHGSMDPNAIAVAAAAAAAAAASAASSSSQILKAEPLLQAQLLHPAQIIHTAQLLQVATHPGMP
mmetsp:Transcript_40996/g.109641  ORF Transcript_40996/g.109641 Transcript_40996/m.109641 type:complete len:278 (+) Transcript_40996:62-895(+)